MKPFDLQNNEENEGTFKGSNSNLNVHQISMDEFLVLEEKLNNQQEIEIDDEKKEL
jgi:hypothetical protein